MTSSARLLAVEDSATQALTLRTILEHADFTVTVATNGEDALEQLMGSRFDLVLSDIVMPGIDGYELCRRIKERDPDLPVVLLTSLTDPLEVIRGLSAGADNFLHKPYDTEQLVSRLRTILFNQELRQDGRANMGLELFFLGRRFMITADRQQILDLLVSTFEDLVGVNQQLQVRERELARAHEEVSSRLEEAELERQRLRAVLSGLPHGLVIVDNEGSVIGANEALGRLVGRPAEEMVGMAIGDAVALVDGSGEAIDPERRPVTGALAGEENVSQGTAFDLFVARADGTLIPAIARSAPIRDERGRVQGAVGIVEDIGGLLAHDPVTGLPGHALFADRAIQAAELSARRGRATAVIVLLVDRFERLRHSFVPTVCDNVVAEVAHRLRAALASGTAGRGDVGASAAYLGNGEFAVVAPELASDVEAMRVARMIVSALEGQVVVDDVQVTVTMSAGVALAGSDDDPRSLVPLAAASARQASASGGAAVLAADSSVRDEAATHFRLEQQLRAGMQSGQIVVQYQPTLLVGSEQVIGVEALVRWRHPDEGLLAPGQFLELAREAGLIAQLSWDVLAEACRQACAWRAELPAAEHLLMSVNLAAEQLAQPDVARRVTEILESTGLDPAGLIVEITESGVLADIGRAADALHALKTVGVQVALDDFGTGYSSLLHLRKLPVDIVKIDRSFVAGLVEDDDDAAIVAGTTRMGHALGLEVLAEGVETEEQLVRLRVLGCDSAQGYHWSPALAPDDFETWWRARLGPRATAADRQPQAALEGSDAHDDALAYVVHELATPLTAILGYTELLIEEVTDAPANNYARALLRNAVDLDSRLRLLTEARAASEGRISLKRDTQDVAHLVNTLVDDVRPQLLPHGVTFTATGPVIAAVDSALVVQAVSNLLSNAAKHAPGDSPIEVSVSLVEGLATIAVRDEGPGVPEHRRPELFRRFARLGSKTKGMGMGLYLCRVIAVAHGGDIRYEPASNGGACFVLSLPALSAEGT